MADKDATQEQDATEQEMREGYKEEPQEESEEESKEEEFISLREQTMRDIEVKRNEEFEEEINESLPSEDVPEEVEIEAGPVWKDGNSWFTTIKIDGEDVEVPFEDLKSSHQKDKASQKRFEEAAEYGKRLSAREAQLNAYIQQMETQPSPSKDAAPEEGQSKDSSDLIKKYHEALYEDDADKAAELFNSLTRGRSQPATQNVEEVVEKVLSRTMAQQRAQSQREQQYAYQKSLEDAVKWFDSEYPDVANSAELRSIADNRTIFLTRENPDWNPKQIMEEAAKSTRQWAKDNLSPDKNERVSRKKRIVQHPKAASRSSKIGEDEAAPQTAADIIHEMKEARGQIL